MQTIRFQAIQDTVNYLEVNFDRYDKQAIDTLKARLAGEGADELKANKPFLAPMSRQVAKAYAVATEAA